MTINNDQPENAIELRHRAEEIAQGNSLRSPENFDELTPEAIKKILYELRVHQIELEMQNEELRAAQVELDLARMRYFDLYDLAPLGYVTISEEGFILEANLTVVGLLGVTLSTLIKQMLSRFIFKDDMDIYYLHRKQLFATGEPQVCDLRMVKKDGTSFWAHLTSNVSQDVPGAPVCRLMISDITVRKGVEAKLQKAMDDIRTLHGILPICMGCKNIRDDQGYWNKVEVYVSERTEAEFSHGLCPDCMKKLYPEFEEDTGNVPKDNAGTP
jgi:PAS domain S-box-containing protein